MQVEYLYLHCKMQVNNLFKNIQMKALVYERANTLNEFAITRREVPDPVIGETDLLIRVKAFSVNPGDTQIRQDKSAPAGAHIILGWEFSGEV